MALSSIVSLSLLYFTAFTTAQTSCPSYSPVCLVSEVPPAKARNRLCGETGTIAKARYLQTTCDAESFEDCRDSCLSNTQCLSFSFDSSNDNACSLYMKTVNAQAFSKNQSATIEYWNRKCFTFATCAPPTFFYLQVQGSQYDGNYGVLPAAYGFELQFSAPTTDGATIFSIDSSFHDDIGAVVSGSSTFANTMTGPFPVGSFSFDQESYIDEPSGRFVPASCSLPSEPPFILSCNDAGDTSFFLYDDFLSIANSDYGSGAGGRVPVTLLAVPAL